MRGPTHVAHASEIASVGERTDIFIHGRIRWTAAGARVGQAAGVVLAPTGPHVAADLGIICEPGTHVVAVGLGEEIRRDGGLRDVKVDPGAVLVRFRIGLGAPLEVRITGWAEIDNLEDNVWHLRGRDDVVGGIVDGGVNLDLEAAATARAGAGARAKGILVYGFRRQRKWTQ